MTLVHPLETSVRQPDSGTRDPASIAETALITPSRRVIVAQDRDLPWISDLSRKWTDQIGFLPTRAQIDYIAAGDVVLSLENGEPAGFMLWMPTRHDTPQVSQIVQVAVELDAHRHSHGRDLLARILREARVRARRLVQCWCAADLEANAFWYQSGFRPVATRTGGQKRGRTHILWRLELVPGSAGTIALPNRRGTKNGPAVSIIDDSPAAAIIAACKASGTGSANQPTSTASPQPLRSSLPISHGQLFSP